MIGRHIIVAFGASMLVFIVAGSALAVQVAQDNFDSYAVGGELGMDTGLSKWINDGQGLAIENHPAGGRGVEMWRDPGGGSKNSFFTGYQNTPKQKAWMVRVDLTMPDTFNVGWGPRHGIIMQTHPDANGSLVTGFQNSYAFLMRANKDAFLAKYGEEVGCCPEVLIDQGLDPVDSGDPHRNYNGHNGGRNDEAGNLLAGETYTIEMTVDRRPGAGGPGMGRVGVYMFETDTPSNVVWDYGINEPVGDMYGHASDQLFHPWAALNHRHDSSQIQPGYFFDNFAIEVIPEPATIGLMGTGVLLLAIRRRRHAA